MLRHSAHHLTMLRRLFKKLFGEAAAEGGNAAGQTRNPASKPATQPTTRRSPEPASNLPAKGKGKSADTGSHRSTKASTTKRLPIDLDIGLDLGTSCTKAVLGDREANKQLAIPLNGGGNLAGYLLPTCVHISGGVYSLDAAKGGSTRRGLKMRIMRAAHAGSEVEHEALCDFAAFAALALRRILAWYAASVASTHPNREPVWHLNVGLPSRGGPNDQFGRIYRRLMRTAVNLAGDEGPITVQRIGALLEKTPAAAWLPDVRLNTFPEAGAQLASLVLSPHRPNGCLLVVDVGAGTMDISTIRVGGDATRGRCIIHCSEVAPLGVHYLQLARKGEWSATGIAPEALESLPEDDGVHAIKAGRRSEVPAAFIERCKQSILPTVTRYRLKLRRAHESEAFRPWSSGLPFVLSGGGRRDQFYQHLLQHDLEKWLTTVVSEWDSAFCERRKGLNVQRFPEPRSFAPRSLLPDFDRFSVAHGLALGVDGLMEMGDLSDGTN